jgi:hypothetical protein
MPIPPLPETRFWTSTRHFSTIRASKSRPFPRPLVERIHRHTAGECEARQHSVRLPIVKNDSTLLCPTRRISLPLRRRSYRGSGGLSLRGDGPKPPKMSSPWPKLSCHVTMTRSLETIEHEEAWDRAAMFPVRSGRERLGKPQSVNACLTMRLTMPGGRTTADFPPSPPGCRWGSPRLRAGTSR